MKTVAVTGAAGAVGSRVVRQLAADRAVGSVLAIDRSPRPAAWSGVTVLQHDLLTSSTGTSPLPVEQVDVWVHLAERESRRDDRSFNVELLRRSLVLADSVGCRHVVVLSSATVYGAHNDNPIPLTEQEAPRPIAELDYAVTKKAIEGLANEWRSGEGRTLSVLRPTTTLSERGSSWVAKALRAATTVRSDQADPPVQFLHDEDLAAALAFVASRELDGVYNVAPDGWIGPEAFRDLVGGVELRVPVAISDRLHDAGRKLGVRRVPPGIEPYVRFPWVVANDKLRRAGWTPAFSNEEAYVLGTPTPAWSVSAQKRQEVALGAASVVVAGAVAAAAGLARRVTR